MSDEIAALDGVEKSFEAKKVLRGIDLSIASGEVVGIAGINGAGKTTAIKILLGLASPDRGAVRYRGLPVSVVRRGKLAVGFLAEESDLPPELTAAEIVRFALWHAGASASARAARSTELLEEAGIAHAARVRVRHMSKGMRRRVALAASLANDPELLVLDEPQSGLDPLGRRDLARIIGRLKSAGTSVLFASHDLSEVEAISDRILILHEGRIAETWDRRRLDEATWQDRFFAIVDPDGARRGDEPVAPGVAG